MSVNPPDLVFDIQRFSIHDGPGIRTTVFLKGCPLRCAWCQNPESFNRGPELLFSDDKCRGCGRCQPVCPHQAIQPGRKSRTERSRCDGCGACVTACPFQARQLVGRAMTTDAVLQEVLRDRDYFDDDGGLTISGGEPLLHRTFVARLLRDAKAAGLHTCIQSCGHVSQGAFDDVKPWVDLIQFDLKHMDPETHQRLTGVPNHTILANARAVAASSVNVQFRMPIIPDANDDRENVDATADFLRGMGRTAVRLVPYRPYYAEKDRMAGRTPRPLLDTRVADERTVRAAQWFSLKGVSAELDA